MADDVLYQGVKGVTDLMVRPGLINLDFADVRAVMDEMGKAMMGTGEAEGEERSLRSVQMALNSPLLDDNNITGAKNILINISSGFLMPIFAKASLNIRLRICNSIHQTVQLVGSHCCWFVWILNIDGDTMYVLIGIRLCETDV